MFDNFDLGPHVEEFYDNLFYLVAIMNEEMYNDEG